MEAILPSLIGLLIGFIIGNILQAKRWRENASSNLTIFDSGKFYKVVAVDSKSSISKANYYIIDEDYYNGND